MTYGTLTLGIVHNCTDATKQEEAFTQLRLKPLYLIPYLTGLAHEAWGAVAAEGVDAVAAGAAVGAWVRGAVVDVHLAGRPGEARRADALVAVDLVPAGGAGAARGGGALVGVDVAVHARPAGVAQALVAAWRQVLAPAVLAGAVP